jgi:hypothetical protein
LQRWGAPAKWPRRRLRGVRRAAAWRQDDSNNRRQPALYRNDWLAVTNVWPEVRNWKYAGTFELANDRRTYRAILVGIRADVEMRGRQRHQRSEGKRDERTTDTAPNAVPATRENHCAQSCYEWIEFAV